MVMMQIHENKTKRLEEHVLSRHLDYLRNVATPYRSCSQVWADGRRGAIFAEALKTIVRIGLLDLMDTYTDLEPSIAKRTVGMKGFLNIAGIVCACSL